MNVPKKRLSVVINTKNEELHIIDCLKSVKNWADEIIVVDMSSTDQTVSIARSLGARIFSVKDIGWVEPVREWSFNKASYEWVLWLDADERVPETLKIKIDEIIKSDKYDVVRIPWKNIFFDKWIKHTLWWPDPHYRLFRKGYIKLENKIHPETTFKGRLLELKPLEKYAVVHLNAENINIWMRKIDTYTSRENHYDKQKHISAKEVLESLDREFVGRYFHFQGYLDGVHGYILSKFMEYYRFLEFVRYWERKGYPELFNKDELRKICEDKYSNKIITKDLQDEIGKLRYSLNQITSSKTFKTWQLFCDLKKQILKYFLHFNHLQ